MGLVGTLCVCVFPSYYIHEKEKKKTSQRFYFRELSDLFSKKTGLQWVITSPVI